MRVPALIASTVLLLGACSTDVEPEVVINGEGAPSSSTQLPLIEEQADEVVHRNAEVDRSQSSFPILFTERACASGSRADDRHRVEVVEGSTSIEISVYVTHRPGEQDCPGNPWTPAVVDLSQPIGERRISGVGQPVDETFSTADVIASSQSVLPADVEFVDVDAQLGRYAEVRCEDLGIPIGPEVQIGEPHLGPESVFADAFVALGGPTEGWFRSQAPHGSTIAIQFYQSTAVATVVLYRNGPGWSAEAARCADMPEGWAPDEALPEPEEGARPVPVGTPATRVNLDEVRSVVEGLGAIEADGNGFRFVDGMQRCAAMNEIEDGLHADGWLVWSTGSYLDDSIQPGESQELDRQVETVVSNERGGAIVIRTAADGAIEIELAPGVFSRPLGTSSIAPCFLEVPVTVNIQPPS